MEIQQTRNISHQMQHMHFACDFRHLLKRQVPKEEDTEGWRVGCSYWLLKTSEKEFKEIKPEVQTANIDLKQVKNVWFRNPNFCERDEECLCGLTAQRGKNRAMSFLSSIKSGNLSTSV